MSLQGMMEERLEELEAENQKLYADLQEMDANLQEYIEENERLRQALTALVRAIYKGNGFRPELTTAYEVVEGLEDV